jgi:hypothetical protein
MIGEEYDRSIFIKYSESVRATWNIQNIGDRKRRDKPQLISIGSQSAIKLY